MSNYKIVVIHSSFTVIQSLVRHPLFTYSHLLFTQSSTLHSQSSTLYSIIHFSLTVIHSSHTITSFSTYHQHSGLQVSIYFKMHIFPTCFYLTSDTLTSAAVIHFFLSAHDHLKYYSSN